MNPCTTDHGKSPRLSGWSAGAMLIATFLILYAVTMPGNHSEAEDAFSYARGVEVPDALFLHPYHVLYLPLMRGLYLLGEQAGIIERAYPLLVGVSVIGGLASLALFMGLLRTRAGMSVLGAAASTALLGLSYGFWRYTCEAEIYLPLCAAALATLWLTTSPGNRWLTVSSGGLMGALSVLLHVFGAAPALVAGPLILLRRGWRQSGAYVVVVLAIVIGVYVGLDVGRNKAGMRPSRKGPFAIPGAMARGVVGAGQSTVSGNFLFAVGGFRRGIQRWYPGRMLEEEKYMGLRASAVGALVPWATLAALAAVLGTGAALAWRTRGGGERGERTAAGASSDPATRRLRCGMSAWLLLHAAAVLWMEPGNPELWVPALVPFWFLFGSFVIEPLARHGRRRLLLTMVLLLGCHNYLGGIRLVQDRDTDYAVAKSRWLFENARRDDLIVTAEGAVFVRYVDYYSVSELLSLQNTGPAAAQAALKQHAEGQGQVFATADVFEPLSYVRIRHPGKYEELRDLATRWRHSFIPVHTNEFGGVFRLMAPPLP